MAYTQQQPVTQVQPLVNQYGAPVQPGFGFTQKQPNFVFKGIMADIGEKLNPFRPKTNIFGQILMDQLGQPMRPSLFEVLGRMLLLPFKLAFLPFSIAGRLIAVSLDPRAKSECRDLGEIAYQERAIKKQFNRAQKMNFKALCNQNLPVQSKVVYDPTQTQTKIL